MMTKGQGTMERQQWWEALERHADGLNQGTDLGARLLAVAAPEDYGALDGLLTTARQVQQALAAQPRPAPRPAFVAQLKSQLLLAHKPARSHWHAPDRRTLFWWAAGAGGVLSAAGLGYLAYRALGSGVSGIMAARAARPALPKAQ